MVFSTLLEELNRETLLSPALFILAAEVLSRSLNALFKDSQFRNCGMPKWSANINHLAYIDDTIIFASADKYSLNCIIKTLQEYERESGQKINKAKSSFYTHQKAGATVNSLIEQHIGISKGQFPMKYLGCPITRNRKRKEHYSDLIRKVKDKLQAWKGKMLSYGGKEVLITSVLQSIPIYMLSEIIPPLCVIREIHRIIATFFWSNKEDGRSKHWAAWSKVCLPKQEGGLGFRSMFEVSQAMYAKLWWRFRSKRYSWCNFIWNKYRKKQIPAPVQ